SVFDEFDEAFIDFSLGAILDDEALPLAGASQLGRDRHDDRIEIRPVGPSSSFKRRGDVHPTQPDFDPIGRYGYLLDNVPDEAFITTGGAASHRSESLDAWLCHVSGFHLLPLSSRRESGY